jgi:hypothetical protein
LPEAPVFNAGGVGKIKCYVETKLDIEEVKWYKNGVLIESNNKYNLNGNMLTIVNLSDEDSGLYECRLNVNQFDAVKMVDVKIKGSLREKKLLFN